MWKAKPVARPKRRAAGAKYTKYTRTYQKKKVQPQAAPYEFVDDPRRRLGVPARVLAGGPFNFMKPLRRVKEPPSVAYPRGRWLTYFAQYLTASAVVEHGFEYVGDCSGAMDRREREWQASASNLLRKLGEEGPPPICGQWPWPIPR